MHTVGEFAAGAQAVFSFSVHIMTRRAWLKQQHIEVLRAQIKRNKRIECEAKTHPQTIIDGVYLIYHSQPYILDRGTGPTIFNENNSTKLQLDNDTI